MEIYLTRHGETIANKNQIREGGRLDGKLSELGKKQIKKLALRLKAKKFKCIYVSDLGRAKETAKAIAKFHPGTPIIILPELREVDVGDFTGKHISDIDWTNVPSNYERDEQVKKRCLKFISKIYPKHKNDTILVVAHGHFNKCLISSLFNNQIHQDIISQNNTCVNILEIKEDGKHNIHLLNCTKHLEKKDGD